MRAASDPAPRERPPGAFGRALLVLLGAGMVGALAQIPALAPLLADLIATLPEAPEMPFAALVALSLVNPLVLILVSAIVGLLLAPRLGLVSHLVRWAGDGTPFGARLRREAGPALAWGALAGGALMLLDRFAGAPLLPERTALYTLTGVLYGGITEEIIARWGLLSLIAWVGARLARSAGAPGAVTMWASLALSAFAFGALHLPYAASLVELTFAVTLKVLALNSLAGLVYGWLFWRRSLEAAMVAHAATHLAMTAVALLLAG